MKLPALSYPWGRLKICLPDQQTYFAFKTKHFGTMAENGHNVSLTSIREELRKYSGGQVDLVKDEYTGIATIYFSNPSKKNAWTANFYVIKEEALQSGSTMTNDRSFLILLMILFTPVHCSGQFWEVEGQYCSLHWSYRQCCQDRDDECILPIMDTFCYCDSFCTRLDGDDCCPDFWEHCLGEPKRHPESDLDYVRHYGRPRG